MYPVINTFIEKEHKGITYKKGETYPKDEHKATAKRVKFLQEKHSRYNVAFLGTEIKPKKPVKKTDAE